MVFRKNNNFFTGTFFFFLRQCNKVQVSENAKGRMKMSEVMNVEAIFAENVFTLGTMKQRLTKKVYSEVYAFLNIGSTISNTFLLLLPTFTT